MLCLASSVHFFLSFPQHHGHNTHSRAETTRRTTTTAQNSSEQFSRKHGGGLTRRFIRPGVVSGQRVPVLICLSERRVKVRTTCRIRTSEQDGEGERGNGEREDKVIMNPGLIGRVRFDKGSHLRARRHLIYPEHGDRIHTYTQSDRTVVRLWND